MLTFDRMTDLTGRPLRGFTMRNRNGKALAIGALGADGFVMPTAKRYARDLSLCRAIMRLTGLPLKWNLAFYCHVVTSHGAQVARAEYERTKGTYAARKVWSFRAA